MDLFWPVLVWSLLFGFLCANMAERKGRASWEGFLVGILVGIFGVIYYWLLPEQEEIDPSKPVDGLRGSLAGVGEEEAVEKEGGNSPSPVDLRAPEEVAIGDYREQEWFYLDEEHQQKGPLSWEELYHSFEESTIRPQTYLWTEGMEEWRQLESLTGLQKELANHSGA